jgi:hypothetical protein
MPDHTDPASKTQVIQFAEVADVEPRETPAACVLAMSAPDEVFERMKTMSPAASDPYAGVAPSK